MVLAGCSRDDSAESEFRIHSPGSGRPRLRQPPWEGGPRGYARIGARGRPPTSLSRGTGRITGR